MLRLSLLFWSEISCILNRSMQRYSYTVTIHIYIYNIHIQRSIYAWCMGGVYLYSTLKYNIYKIVLTCCRRRCCCSGC